jgi:hypothetical protein
MACLRGRGSSCDVELSLSAGLHEGVGHEARDQGPTNRATDHKQPTLLTILHEHEMQPRLAFSGALMVVAAPGR